MTYRITPFRTAASGLVLMLLSLSSLAQSYKNEKLIWRDENGQQCKEKNAALLLQTVQVDDTLWETNLYRIDGPRVVSFQSNTADGTMLNGRYITYSFRGQVDTFGNYHNGKRTGYWSIHTDGLHGSIFVAQQFYSNGELIWQKDTLQLHRERDSIKVASDKEEIQTKVEIESEFPGGPAAWLRFLNHNLRYPDEAVKKGLMGQPVVEFIVDKTGFIAPASIWMDQSIAYPLDKETMRVIALSGKWTPAVQNGRQVRSYKRQPIVFKMEVINRK
ncbi:energy transducer TonB [Puia dinghuensis]|uniref:TonB C-terminal domain-containing protein n=1 Tax=Puia dinghuensis TaxID=1792502 RepID=A0A8J2UEQ3_9BACT|nr:energy transducer TonB [Puia dinghuensis]GGB06034.1 hypothetical protein GCM10011511_31800 [Puia dinghuensis]